MREILIDPPRLIDPAQRVKYGAIASITQMTELAFADLKETAAIYAQAADKPPFDNPECRFRALNLAWSIVDQADLLRQIITSEGQHIQLIEAQAFLAEAEPIKEVRNWMRHLPQRLAAYMKKGEPLPPALGALSFTIVKRVRDGISVSGEILDADVVEYHTLVLLSAAFQRGARLEGEPEPYRTFKTPVDHFYLQAFGKYLNLERIVASITGLCDSLSEGVGRFVDSVVSDLKAKGTFDPILEQPQFESGQAYTMTARRD